MRPDMAKIIVERPRVGGGCRYPRYRDRALLDNADWENAPAREPHKSRHFKREKHFNETLAPLRRFLRGSIGRPWNEVHAEIAAQVPCDTTVNRHVWQHVEMEVKQHVIIHDGKPYTIGRFLPGWPLRGLYVDPRDGILREAPRETKHERRLRRTLKACSQPSILSIDGTLEYHRIAGIWYAVTFAQIPPGAAFVWDVLKREISHVAHEGPGGRRTGRFPAHKRQLSKREIRRTLDPRLRQLAAQHENAASELARLSRARQVPGSSIFAAIFLATRKGALYFCSFAAASKSSNVCAITARRFSLNSASGFSPSICSS